MKKKIIWLIVIGLLVFTGGCRTQPQSLSENEMQNNPVQEEMQVDDAWKKEMAQKLLQEFHFFYANMYKDDFIYYRDENMYLKNEQNKTISYNRVMAADRAVALLGVYRAYISAEDLAFIESKKSEINELIYTSTIYFGYTQNGLHIIALMPDTMNDSLKFRSLKNLLRKDPQESELQFGMNDFAAGISNKLYDIYVEDLTNQREEISVAIKFFVFERELPIKTEFLEFEQEILKNYNRIANIQGEIKKTQEWNLFVIESSLEADVVECILEKESLRLQRCIKLE